MKTFKTCLLLMCLSAFTWQTRAQALVDVYTGSSLPTSQGWGELRFDNSMPWEQAAKDLLVAPEELTAVAGTALKLKANAVLDDYGFPLYSQLGWYKTNMELSPAIGYTVEFRAKIVNSPDGAFTVSGVGAGKGFRLKFSNNLLTEHANVLDTVRVLSNADNTDGFHTYRVAVAPNDKVYVWRDGVSLGELPLQPFKLDNILDDGGFENGGTPEDHGWTYHDEGTPGTMTVSNDPKYVKSGKYGLFVDKGTHKNQFIPAKPGAMYNMTAWGKTISYSDVSSSWRDLCGRHDPAADRTVYFIGDKKNEDWKYYEKLNMEGGAHFQRFIVETPTGSSNDYQMAYDDLHYSEQIRASRIPAGAVNLFPNGDFEDPCADYFPAGDPRNDTCIVSPENFRYSADAYYGGRANDDPAWFGGSFSAEHNAAPFWHPFWGTRVRLQYNRQSNNDEAGNHWARGKYSLRYFNCGGANIQYGNDFSVGVNENRGSNSELKTAPIVLEVGKKYTFLFSYHNARWENDGMNVIVKNGSKEIYRREARGNNTFPGWRNEVIEFTTDASNHALQIQTERLSGSWEGFNATPSVIYFEDFFLFEGELLPEDNTHLFFGKQTSLKGAEVEIEYIKVDNTGAFGPTGPVVDLVPYNKKTAPLMTVWGESLQGNDPILNEYPRPQLKRVEWTNLNGVWNYTRKSKEGFGTYNANDQYRQQILVPFPVESALSGIKDEEYDNQNKTYSYNRTVTIAKPTDGKRVMLHFGAVDWESYVFVNGQEVAHHKGGFDPFSADITDVLNANGTQEIVVQAFDPTRGGQPSGKQNPHPGGDQYTPSSGIWQTVWTETVNPTYVTNVELTPVNNAAVKVKVEAANADGATAIVKVLDGTSAIASTEVAVGTETSIAIGSPKLWSPESPFLYNVEVELKKNNVTTDVVTSYFGMREIEVKMLRDKPFVYLNGQPTFSYATLDHGFFPDGLFTPASYDAMRHDLKKLKELGFNAVRKFEKIEPAIWYHLADSIGLLVWQDIPAAHVGTPIAELNTETARKANFLSETAAITKTLRNFPSVVAWIGFNDGWGRYNYDHVKNTVDLFRSLNDGRLILPESGPDDFELGDVVSRHGLPLPVLHPNAYNERASVCFVTGNYNYAISGHLWDTSSSSDIKNDSTYAARLKEFSDASKNLTLSGMAGLAIVQTTDVENEVNGLMTYDRKVYKAGGIADSQLKANADFLKTKIAAPILRTGSQGGEMWKYLAGAKDLDAGAGWNSDPNFNYSADWKDGLGGFGSKMTNSYPNTPWTGDNRGLFLRKNVYIPTLEPGDKLQFRIFYDEDYEFYINGYLAHSSTGYVTNYVTIEIDPNTPIVYGGDNLFAIHVIQNSGGAYMDLGLTAEKLSNPIDYEPVPEPIVWKDIATAQDWMNIQNDLYGFYRLVDDIDLYSATYTPIGSTETPFRGYVDGQNHTVTCPYIQGGDRIGLFGYADGAHFVNLRFISAEVSGGADVGILLGRGKGITVEHVVFDDSQYPHEIKGRDHVGVIAGMLESGKVSTIKDVYVKNAKVESTEWQAAGLVGIICDTRIINSYFTGTVSIIHENYLTAPDRDASGIVSRTEGGKNFLNGVMSLATSVQSASSNEFISFNGGGYIVIDSATCFTRSNMTPDPIFNPDRNNMYARASESMKRPEADFQSSALYKAAGWDFVNVWGTPIGGGFPIFRYLGGVEPTSVPSVKIENNLKVYSENGQLVLVSDRLAAVWIYNLQGALVERIDFTGTQSVVLPHGVYIVKSVVDGNVKGTKVFNR